jgi:hypothetical protein
VPRKELAEIDDVTSGMADLAKLDGKGLANALSPIVEAYGADRRAAVRAWSGVPGERHVTI